MFVTAGCRTTRLNLVMAPNLKSSPKSIVCVSAVRLESHTCSVATPTALVLPFLFLYLFSFVLRLDGFHFFSSALPSFSPLPERQPTIYLPGDIAATCNSFAPLLNFSETLSPPPARRLITPARSCLSTPVACGSEVME